VQCSGAYEKISADCLVPRGADHNQQDLIFLDFEQTIHQKVEKPFQYKAKKEKS
jgi:hypothetical protein